MFEDHSVLPANPQAKQCWSYSPKQCVVSIAFPLFKLPKIYIYGTHRKAEPITAHPWSPLNSFELYLELVYQKMHYWTIKKVVVGLVLARRHSSIHSIGSDICVWSSLNTGLGEWLAGPICYSKHWEQACILCHRSLIYLSPPNPK